MDFSRKQQQKQKQKQIVDYEVISNSKDFGIIWKNLKKTLKELKI